MLLILCKIIDILLSFRLDTWMRIGIDLRFYSPEPYGLSFHIRDLMEELLPLLEKEDGIDTICLIFRHNIKGVDLSEKLSWWKLANGSQKFEIFYTNANYYTISEQTTFLFQLYRLNLDLMYFFTFNYPILYDKPFIYQILDLIVPKTKPKLSLKIQALLLCLKTGLKNAKHVLILGNNTKNDLKAFFNSNFEDRAKRNYINHTVVYNGVNQKYLVQSQSNKTKADISGVKFDVALENKAKTILTNFKITKPYFYFISVWRKYKNIEKLVEAFEQFQYENDNKYQLVLSGTKDPDYPEVEVRIKASEQFGLGNIVITGKIESDEDVICLYDQSLAMINPTLSEGFGLWMVEAASRSTNILCSDIEILREIANPNEATFFDPDNVSDIVTKMNQYVSLDVKSQNEMVLRLHKTAEKFKWQNTAQIINNIIKTISNDESRSEK